MPTDRMTHAWQPVPGKPAWIEVPGKPVALVRTTPLPQGYLWQHGKQYGFCDTLAQAKDWCETAREWWPRKL
jgi:hypothetical protein